METATGRNRCYTYYACGGKKSQRNGCPGVRWQAEALETALEKKIVKAVFSEASFARLEKRLQAYRMKLATRQVEEVPPLKLKLSGVERKMDRVVRKLAEDTISDQEARRLLADLRRDRDHYKAQLEELTGGGLATLRVSPTMIKALSERVSDLVRDAGPRQKREFYRGFIGRIEVDQTHVRIHYWLQNLTARLGGGSFSVGGLASPTGTENKPNEIWVNMRVA